MNKVIKINIARDFSKSPGCRYKKDCLNSGEAFRDDVLLNARGVMTMTISQVG